MKKIKIYTFPTHGTHERTTGVDFVRMMQPMEALNGYKYGDYEFEVMVYDVKKHFEDKDTHNWLKIAKNYDIIYLNYMPNAWGYAAMGAMARANNRKIVMDLDDSLWDLKPDNSAHAVYHKGSEALSNFTAMCNDVDYITCTNSYLKNVILNNTYKRAEKVKVFPNYVDLNFYKHRSSAKVEPQLTLLHYGSTTHFVDLQEQEFANGVDKIMQEYPNVKVKFVGAFIPDFKRRWGHRYENAFGHSDIYKWVDEKFPEFMDEADVIVVPLTNDKYNKCKSSIKFIETASAKKPGVWQKIRQYEEVIDGKNGFLARTADDWYQAIKKLTDDVELRREMGENAYKTVEKNWQMKDHLEDYAKFFIETLDTP